MAVAVTLFFIAIVAAWVLSSLAVSVMTLWSAIAIDRARKQGAGDE